MIKLNVSAANIAVEEKETLTEGRVGLLCRFSFTGEWDGLAKTAVFDGADSRDVILTEDTVAVPAECLAAEGYSLSVGVYGKNAAGDIVIPTVYATVGKIQRSAYPAGKEAAPPTPDVVAQIQQAAANAEALARAVREDAELGKFKGDRGDAGATGPAGPRGPKGDTGAAGTPGEDGGWYTPAITQPDENTMRVSFSPSKEGMPQVQPTDITLPAGSGSGGSGADGGYYTPEVTQTSENTMQVAFSPSKTSMPAVSGTEITLPAGQKGDKGDTGATGADGKSAYAYAVEGGYTGTEAEFAAKMAEDPPSGYIIEASGGDVVEGNMVVWDGDRTMVRDGGAVPIKLPNPNALTFTGAVSESYDGSEAVTVEIPSGSGGDGLSAFEKIGTIDLSTMAGSNLGVEYTVTDVTEVVLVWTGMTNTTTNNSSLNLQFNNDTSMYNTLGPKTGKAGSPVNGYTYLKVLEGVGLLPIVSQGAISNTNYALVANGGTSPYNLIPVKEKIQTLKIGQPSTQYYADAGIVEVYVR